MKRVKSKQRLQGSSMAGGYRLRKAVDKKKETKKGKDCPDSC
jgi:hypothetical protein